MSRYLITGGAGFIGSHLADLLTECGHEICIIDDLSTGNRDQVPPSARFIQADIRQTDILEQSLQGCDGCFHLAAVASVTRCHQQWADSHEINVGASVRLFEAAARLQIPIVYASSAAVYGDNPRVPLKETEAVSPLSFYGIDKAACEMHARSGAEIHNLRSIGLRFFNVYGPRQSLDDAYAGVITLFTDRLSRSEDIVIYGDGGQTRDFIHVDDITRGVYAAMLQIQHMQPGGFAQILNFCSGKEVSILELARSLAAEFKSTSRITFAAERPNEIRRSAGCPEKSRNMLNFRPSSRQPWYKSTEAAE